MKLSILALIGVGIFILAHPAWADTESARFTKFVNDTQNDYDTLKSNFRAAYRVGTPSWDDYSMECGFSVEDIERRIIGRRIALARLAEKADKAVPEDRRGLSKMLIRDLDRVNLSLLALIRDDRGYAGYLRTRDQELIRSLTDWQEGIRLAIKEARRCIVMVKAVAGQLDLGHAPALLRAH